MINGFKIARKQKRHIIAVYPDGARHEMIKTAHGWQYHPRGSCASPLVIAKLEAIDEGANIKIEYSA